MSASPRPIGPWTELRRHVGGIRGYTYILRSDGYSRLYSPQSPWYVEETVSRTGWNSGKGWRTKLEQGTLAPTPAALVHVCADADVSPANLRWYYPQSLRRYDLEIEAYSDGAAVARGYLRTGLDSVFGSPDSSLISNLAKQGLVEEIRGAEMEILQIYAELHETAKGLASLSYKLKDRFVDYVTRTRRMLRRPSAFGGLSNPSRAIAQSLADGWLEFHFGIEPTISDINDMIEFLYQNGFARAISRRVKSKRKTSWHKVQLYKGSLPYVGTDVPVLTSIEFERRMFYGCGIRLGTNPYSWMTDAVRAGFDPSGVIRGTWEIIPWSWALDGFSNVNDVLANLLFTPPAYDHGWSYTLVEDRVNWWESASASNSTKIRSFSGGRGTGKYVRFNRTTGVPGGILPDLYWGSDKLSTLKAVSIDAAITQLVMNRTPFRVLGRTIT